MILSNPAAASPSFVPPGTGAAVPFSPRPFLGTKCPGIVCDSELSLHLANMLEAEPTIWAYDDAGDGFLEALVEGERVLFVAVPTNGSQRTRVMELASRHEAEGRRVCRVSAGSLLRQPVKANRELVAGSGDAWLAPVDRVKILDRILGEGGSSTLGELACLVNRADDPVASVLSLVVVGVLRIDMDQPIDAESRVERVSSSISLENGDGAWT